MTTQRKSALPAGTGEDAHEKNEYEKICRLHITISRPVCQTLRGIVAWAALLGLLGVIGGMDQETIRFWPGIFWAVILMAAWIASLAAGGWLE